MIQVVLYAARHLMLGERIQQVRNARDLSQEELSELTGISLRQIGRYETGQNNPPSDKLDLIAKALHVSPAYLLGRDEDAGDPFAEEFLSPLERKLIDALRSGRFKDALETFTALSNQSE